MNKYKSMTLAEICLEVCTQYGLNPTTDVKLIMEFFIENEKLTKDELRQITELDSYIKAIPRPTG